MGCLLETHFSSHFPQKLFLPVPFREYRQRNLSEVFPQGQIQEWISGLFPVHPDGSIVSAQVTNPQSFHIEQHFVFHLLISCSLEGYSVPGVPSEDLICAKPCSHDVGLRDCAGEVEGSCNVEIHMGSLGINALKQFFLHLLKVLYPAVNQDQPILPTRTQSLKLFE